MRALRFTDAQFAQRVEFPGALDVLCDDCASGVARELKHGTGQSAATPACNAVGTLCLIDREPRTLAPVQIEAMQGLSRHVVARMQLRKAYASCAITLARATGTNCNSSSTNANSNRRICTCPARAVLMH